MSRARAQEIVSSENGSNGGVLDWQDIDWARHEEAVRRLRQRIFKATQDGSYKKVRNLQKLMLRSYSNTLVSVKRVTQQNSGRKTAGIDGMRDLSVKERAALATSIHVETKPWKARPVKRVYIPKSSGKQRPLGIPVIADRVMQARVKNALEPEWEARFEPRSYGFRPGRGCHDAREAIYTCARAGCTREWVVDADLAAAFDHINHDHLLAALGAFPGRGLIRGWLKAGVMDRGHFAPTEEGTPQGGVISPLLLNVALHGMEKAAGCRYEKKGAGRALSAAPGTPILIRYADDFVVLCHSESDAYRTKERLSEWLAPRGLVFNEDKTKVVHLNEGFDFLGFNVRRYDGKLLIKPSKTAVARLRERLRTEMKALRGANVEAVLLKLSPLVRGWSAYYRVAVSSKIFGSLDTYVWKLTFKWARHAHPTKSRDWVIRRYFGRFNASRNDHWVFGNRAKGAYLPKFAWTKIERHEMVKGGASKDDPALAAYWARRTRASVPSTMDKASLALAERQRGICPLCGQALISGAEFGPQSPREWIEWFASARKRLHKHHLVYRRHGGTDVRSNLRLVHSDCHRRHHAGDGRRTGEQDPAKSQGSA